MDQWITVFVSVKIAHDYRLVGDGFNIFRIDGYFAAAAGGIDYKLRDCIAGGVAAQGANDFDPFARIRAQVCTAGNFLIPIHTRILTRNCGATAPSPIRSSRAPP